MWHSGAYKQWLRLVGRRASCSAWLLPAAGNVWQGILMVKTQPVTGALCTLSVPLFASTLRREIESPRPMPLRSFPVWVKG